MDIFISFFKKISFRIRLADLL